MKLKNPPSKALLAFDVIGGSISAYFLVASWLALNQGHYEPIGFIGNMYIVIWVVVSVVWNNTETKRRLKKEEERRRVIERDKASEEFFRKLHSENN